MFTLYVIPVSYNINHLVMHIIDKCYHKYSLCCPYKIQYIIIHVCIICCPNKLQYKSP